MSGGEWRRCHCFEVFGEAVLSPSDIDPSTVRVWWPFAPTVLKAADVNRIPTLP